MSDGGICVPPVDHKKDELPIAFQLGATTWRVLLSLLSNRGAMGVRELSNKLSLSSPSVALYHLEKLVNLGLASKSASGEYYIRDDADLGFLDNYLFFEHGALPRMAFYAVFITGLLLVYAVTVPFDFGAHNVYALVIALAASSFFWLEVHRSRRLLRGQ
ncbi:MAG: hypothetical protein C4K49_12460 [Candidatus Thorarchaeota archaeon]|nr:MAG: hypothetical protein C4K49_12460 [Candidatus Thorarchaeota archaeon]